MFNFQKINEFINIKKKIKIERVCSVVAPQNNSLLYIVSPYINFISNLKNITNSLIICEKNLKIDKIYLKHNQVIYVNNPKYFFACLLKKIKIKNLSMNIKNSEIHPEAKINSSTIIGSNVFIDSGVKIGSNCLIYSGVKIFKNVIIGNNVIIGPNCVIGYQGFGIDRELETTHKKIPLKGNPVKIEHSGGVVIKNNVDLGSLNTVCSGTFEPTIINSYVVTDDHVHIAHNCILKKGCAIAACAQLSGGVIIGKNTWVGPNTSFREKVKIGNYNIIGIGAVIIRNTSNHTTWFGNPAKKLTKKKGKDV
jgi:UDP-3-O-[3-hydroxymyristoyl] glucosamine N-acyltransferase LpxD